MKKLVIPLFVSLAFGAGTVYGSAIGSGVAYSMIKCP